MGGSSKYSWWAVVWFTSESLWAVLGFCDDMKNNVNCTKVLDNVGGGADQFDGGDCCGTDAMHNYCIDCICFSKMKFNIAAAWK